MGAGPEAKVKDRVKKLLKKYGAYQFWPVQTGYGAATLDCLGCYNGLFFSIETKAPTKHLTPRQELTMQDMNKAGGAVFVVGEAYITKAGTVAGLKVQPGDVVSYSGMAELETWLELNKR